MSITPVDSEDPADIYPTIDSVPPQVWEKVGKIALVSFSLVAVGAFIPALFKKKRIYSIPSPYIPPTATEEVALSRELPAPRCTPEEQRKVEEIFITTAKGGIALIASGFRLMQLGEEIDHIHPFSFLLAAPKECVRTIFHEGNRFAKGRVMGGIRKGMKREYTNQNLDRYASSFAKAMGKVPQQVKALIQSQNWAELVRYVFDIHKPIES